MRDRVEHRLPAEHISKSRVTSLESAYFHPAEFDLPDAPLTLADISILCSEQAGGVY